MGARTKFRAARLQHDWNIRSKALDHAGEFESGLGTELAVPGKFDVRDEPEDIFAILLNEFGGVFEIRCEQDFRSRLHSYQLVGDVDALLNHAPRLLDQLGINHGKE